MNVPPAAPHVSERRFCCVRKYSKAILDLVDRLHSVMTQKWSCDFKVRIGLNSGKVVAGTIRASQPRFQIFGRCCQESYSR